MSRVLLASFDRVPSPKGASAHILANARILSERHEVSLVTLGTETLRAHRHRPIHIAEPNWLRRGLLFEQRVGRVLAEYDFDVYHVRSPWEGLAVPPERSIVYEVNALYSVEAGYHFPATTSRASLRRKLRAREKCLLERATRIVTPSAVTAQYLIDIGADPDRVRIIPNAPSIGATVAPLPLRHDRLRLCYVGTLTAWQGLAELIDALRKLPALSTGPELRFELSIVASGNKVRRKWIQKLLRKRSLDGCVRFVEPMNAERLGAFLAEHDIGLAPLISCERNLVQGCQPIKILDYAAAGLAVLAPDMPVVRDILGPDYPLYRRWSPSHMIEELAALMRSPPRRAELSTLGHARIAAGFSVEQQRQRLLALYVELAS